MKNTNLLKITKYFSELQEQVNEKLIDHLKQYCLENHISTEKTERILAVVECKRIYSFRFQECYQYNNESMCKKSIEHKIQERINEISGLENTVHAIHFKHIVEYTSFIYSDKFAYKQEFFEEIHKNNV